MPISFAKQKTTIRFGCQSPENGIVYAMMTTRNETKTKNKLKNIAQTVIANRFCVFHSKKIPQ